MNRPINVFFLFVLIVTFLCCVAKYIYGDEPPEIVITLSDISERQAELPDDDDVQLMAERPKFNYTSAFQMKNNRLVRLPGGTYDWGGCGRRSCMICLANHLQGLQHGIRNQQYLQALGVHSWAILHDNLHNGGHGCVNVEHRHTEYYFTAEVKDFDRTGILTVPSWYTPTAVFDGQPVGMYATRGYLGPARYYNPPTAVWSYSGTFWQGW